MESHFVKQKELVTGVLMDSIGVIILAAGHSARMGMPKGLLAFKGTTLLEYSIQQALASNLVVGVVVAKDDKSYIPLLQQYDVQIIINDNYSLGPFYSIWLALKQVNFLSTFILPVDVPLVPVKILRRLIDKDYSAVKVKNKQGSGGHPLWINRELITYIKGLVPDRQLRLDHLIRKSCFNIKEVVVDHPYPYAKCNTLDDYQHFLASLAD